MNTTIVLYGVVLIAFVVYAMYLERRVRYLEDEIDACLSDIDDMEMNSKAQADLSKSLVSMIMECANKIEDYNKRLDKFEFAVEKSEGEADFTKGIDAILGYDALDALKQAKKERGDA